MFKNHIKLLFLTFFTVFYTSVLFAQKSYLTPKNSFIKITEGQQWEYIEQPNLLQSTNLSLNELSEINALLLEVYSKEAEFYSKFIAYKYQLDQKTKLTKEERETEKNYIEKYKSAGILIESLLNIDQIDISEIPSELNRISLAFQVNFQGSPDSTSQEKEPLSKSDMVQIEPQKYLNPKTPIQDHQNFIPIENVEIKIDSIYHKNMIDEYSFDLDERNGHQLLREANCDLIFDGFDESLNSYRKETKLTPIIYYTHPKLIRHFKEKSFLIGSASLIKSDERFFLNLEIIIKSKDARRSYGYIEKGAMLRITLISGKKLFLQNRILSTGSLESYSGNTKYECFYTLEKEDVKDLEDLEIDKLGLMWTSGFEEYPIYKIDFIQNQIYCLKNERQN